MARKHLFVSLCGTFAFDRVPLLFCSAIIQVVKHTETCYTMMRWVPVDRSKQYFSTKAYPIFIVKLLWSDRRLG